MKNWRAWCFAPAVIALLCCNCQRERRGQPTRAGAPRAWLVLELPALSDLDPNDPRFTPKSGVIAVRRVGSTLTVELSLEANVSTLLVDLDGTCPSSFDLRGLEPGQVVRRALRPWIDFGPRQVQIGYGARFEIRVRPGCPEAQSGQIRWSVVSGAELSDIRQSQNGFLFEAKTAPLARWFPGGLNWGIAPISPRTRAETVLKASWTAPGRRAVTRRVVVSAAARSHGLPSVSTHQRLFLGGSGWRLVSHPDGAQASIRADGDQSTIEPDVAGLWKLEDGQGRELRIRSGRYDDTPLDCGRSECHAKLTANAAASPMTTVLRRGLAGALGAGYGVACAVACHTVGEPGVEDGGFWSVASALGVTWSDPNLRAWERLPSALRRLGGVGCLGCHGPGAVPEPSSRWSILQAGVCAYCHDAPPRYGHVAAWQSSKMAQSDHDPRARSRPECARCHTTSGFLDSLKALGGPRSAPLEAGPLGIACAACHAVHPTSPETAESHAGAPVQALLRAVAVPPALSDLPTPSRDPTLVCLRCHAPEAGAPDASAAAIWAGRGGFEPSSGAPLSGSAPHLNIAGGCVGCHNSGPSGLERGSNHAFLVDRKTCRPCHATAPTASTELRDRILALYSKLGLEPANRPLEGSRASEPPHASLRRLDLGSPRGRAQYNALLVVEDPAAEYHNRPYAERLLESAEAALKMGSTSAQR